MSFANLPYGKVSIILLWNSHQIFLVLGCLYTLTSKELCLCISVLFNVSEIKAEEILKH